MGFNQGQVIKAFDELAGGQLETLLSELAFQQGVSQQGLHIEHQHRSDALVLMEVDGGNLQVAFANVEAFFNIILVPVELEYLPVRQRPIVGDQQIATIFLLSLPQSVGIYLPAQVDLARLRFSGRG